MIASFHGIAAEELTAEMEFSPPGLSGCSLRYRGEVKLLRASRRIYFFIFQILKFNKARQAVPTKKFPLTPKQNPKSLDMLPAMRFSVIH